MKNTTHGEIGPMYINNDQIGELIWWTHHEVLIEIWCHLINKGLGILKLLLIKYNWEEINKGPLIIKVVIIEIWLSKDSQFENFIIN